MQPFLYRPGSKRRFLVAFVAAAAIHLSALGFAPTHPRIAASATADWLPDIELEPPPPEPEPVQFDPITRQFEEPKEPNEFWDTYEQPQQPLPNPRKRIRPPHARNAQTISPNRKLLAISAPLPNYPYEARSHYVTGSGTVLLDVDPVTGSVIKSTMRESTGSPILDNSALSAFRRWRFKPGTPSPVKIPFTFTMAGAHL